MSDVVVSTTNSVTSVTTSDNTVDVAVITSPVIVSSSSVGLQGPTGATGSNGVGYTNVTSTTSVTIGSGLKTFTLVSGNQGAFITGMRVRAIHSDTPTYFMEGTANYIGGGSLLITVDKLNGSGSHNSWFFAIAGEIGQTGANGASGVVSVVSPITNTGSASSAIIGINQSALSLTTSQISDFTSGTVASAGTAQQAGTAVYSTTAGSALNAGTAVSLSGSITKSQVSDFTSGTVAVAGSATTASTSLTSGTAVYATSAGSALNAGTAVSVSGSAITKSQISDFTSGTVTSISGTVTQSQVSGLSSTLANYATLGSANIFTLGSNIFNSGGSGNTALIVRGASGQLSDVQQWQTSASAVIGGVSSIGQIYAGSTGVITAGTAGSGFAATALTSAAYTSATVAVFTYPLTVQVVSVGQKVAVTGVTGGAYNGIWLVTAVGGSSGAYTFTVQGSGFTNIAGSGGFFSVSATLSITANSQLTVPLIIQGAASQTARLIEFQNSSGTAIASVGASGGITVSSINSTGGVTISGANNPLTVGGTAGTSGQVLTSAGTGLSPSWSNPTSKTVIQTVALSGTSAISFSSIPATYRDLEIRILATTAVTTGTSLTLTVNGLSTSIYLSVHQYVNGVTPSPITYSQQTGATSANLTPDTFGAQANSSLILTLPDYGSSSFKKGNVTWLGGPVSGTYFHGYGAIFAKTTAAISSISIAVGGSGGITGSAVLLGVN